jgi:hypothetical protein
MHALLGMLARLARLAKHQKMDRSPVIGLQTSEIYRPVTHEVCLYATNFGKQGVRQGGTTFAPYKRNSSISPNSTIVLVEQNDPRLEQVDRLKTISDAWFSESVRDKLNVGWARKSIP